jgi:hypothetical protein
MIRLKFIALDEEGMTLVIISKSEDSNVQRRLSVGARIRFTDTCQNVEEKRNVGLLRLRITPPRLNSTEP